MKNGRVMHGLAVAASIAMLAACGSSGGSSGESSGDPSAGSPAAATSPDPSVATPVVTAQDQVAGTAVPEPSTAATAAPAAIPELLNFTASLVGGGEFSGAGAAGRTTVFWFWAPT